MREDGRMVQGNDDSGQGSFRVVLFDLLSALLDSWALWDRMAGSSGAGRRWRFRYLQLTYAAEHYSPYETLVLRAAREVGLEDKVAGELIERWDELRPWPEVGEVLHRLQQVVPTAVVTNCSEELARRAVACSGTAFPVVVSAERAGFYKPRPEPYRLALAELGVKAEEVLFVAGSAYDVPGAQRVGMQVFWHNRLGLSRPEQVGAPLAEAETLSPLLRFFGSEV